jgi:N-acetylglucosamine malate deacetylase 1
VPHLTHNPVFLYYPDSFQKPNPFQPDVAVAIDSVIQKKLDALDALESQFYEGGANGSQELVPSEPAKQQERKQQVRAGFEKRYQNQAQRFRSKLAEFYGQDKAASVKYAEAFEICEYGRRPTQQELKQLFPFFGE